MRERKVFSYTYSGVTDEKKLKKSLDIIPGIIGVRLENGVLTYSIDEHFNDYDIECACQAIVENDGGEFGYIDDEVNSTKSVANESSIGEADANGEETAELDENKEDTAPIVDDYFDEDELVKVKKSFKSDLISRIVEFSVSLVCFILGVILDKGVTSDNFFTISNILYVFAFAFAASENVFYNSIVSISKKDFLNESVIVAVVSLAGVLLAFLMETTLLVVAFSLLKGVEAVSNGLRNVKLEDAFYTGAPEALKSDKTEIATSKIEIGDEIEVAVGETVPCDGICQTECEVDLRRFGKPVYKLAKNGKVLAGSVVSSGVLTVKVTAKKDDSELTRNKALFEEKLNGCKVGNPKTDKILKYITVGILAVSLLAMFLLPLILKTEDVVYYVSLRSWAVRFLPIMALSILRMPLNILACNLKNAVLGAKFANAEFDSEKAYLKYGNANTVKINAEVLADGKTVKTEALGAMKELKASGIKNIVTLFDGCELSGNERDSIDFVETPTKRERAVTVAKSNADVNTLSGEGVRLELTSLRILPLSYRQAKRYAKSKKRVITALVLAAITLPLAIALPMNIFASIFFAPIGYALLAVSVLFSVINNFLSK